MLVSVALLGCGAPEDRTEPSTEKHAALTTVLFTPAVTIATPASSSSVVIGDLNGDGRNDVAMTTYDISNDAGNYVNVFIQGTNGSFLPRVTYPVPGRAAESMDIGDVNGDGRADLVVGITNSLANGTARIGVFLQNASGTLNPMVSWTTENSYQVKVGDLNSDGRMDFAGINWGNRGDGLDVFLQTAAGTIAPPVTYHVQHGGWDELDAGDLNGDGRTDLVVMSGQLLTPPDLSVLTQNADGTLAAPVGYSLSVSDSPVGVALGDTNGDQKDDVVVSYGGNQPNSRVARFLQSASGTLDPAVAYPSYDVPGAMVLADVDGDSRKDLVVLHEGWSRFGVYRQTAAGDFGTEELYTIPNASHYAPQGIAVGDVNGDGLPDVVIADVLHGLILVKHVDDIPPTVAVTAPLGGSFFPGVPIGITWTANDNAALGGFDLAASFDGGATYSPIAGCTALPATARNCNWTPTGSPTVGVSIRVTARDVTGNKTSAVTSIDLIASTLSVTAPAAGSTLYAGAPATVTWTSNLPGSATFKVELSRDGGGSFETLATAAPNTGSFAWTVTGPDASAALVRVSASSPSISATSAAFAITTPAVVVGSPAAGSVAYTGNAVAITWITNLTGVATARVELSRDGGASFELLAAAAPNTGSFAWIATSPDTGAAMARITIDGPPVVSGVSGPFTVLTPAVTVSAPADGATLYAGTAQAITWSSTLPPSATMLIELTRDGGATFEILAAAAPNTGSFSWTVTGPDTTIARVRVSSSDPAAASGTSGQFAIVTPGLAVTSPTAGASWLVGTAQTITWTSNLPASGPVLIDLSRDGGATFQTLAAAAPNTGSFSWTAAGPPSASAVVRVSLTSPTTVSGTSGTFVIADPTLAVTAPAAGATWAIGTAQAITWTSNLPASGTVKIELSRNSGSTYTTLAASAPNAGSFSWMVTGAATTTARVRISSNGSPAVTAVGGTFSIVNAALTVTSPNTVVTWLVGSAHAITWTHNVGASAQFKIEVSRNGGSTWTQIAAAAPASGATSGSFNWTVAAPRSETCRIRVTWNGNTAVKDSSNVNFRIR